MSASTGREGTLGAAPTKPTSNVSECVSVKALMHAAISPRSRSWSPARSSAL